MSIEKSKILQTFGQAYSTWLGIRFGNLQIERTTKQSITEMFEWGANNLDVIAIIASQLENAIEHLSQSKLSATKLPSLSHLTDKPKPRITHEVLCGYLGDLALKNDDKSFVNQIDSRGLLEFLFVSIYSNIASQYYDQSINQVELMHSLRQQMSRSESK